MKKKKCTKCKRVLPLEKFSIDKNGIPSWCKECMRENARLYYQNHREERLEYAKKYRASQEGRKKRQEYEKLYERNPIRKKEAQTEHRLRHKAKIQQSSQIYRFKNKNKIRKHDQEYLQTPQGRFVTLKKNHKRRALLMKAQNDVSEKDIRQLLNSVIFCPICGNNFNSNGRKKTIDHIVPLSKGGTHTLKNLQILCLSCNCKKGDRIFVNKDAKYTATK